MDVRWLYCFQCRMSHLFKRVGSDTWKCPNCGYIRQGPEDE